MVVMMVLMLMTRTTLMMVAMMMMVIAMVRTALATFASARSSWQELAAEAGNQVLRCKRMCL